MCKHAGKQSNYSRKIICIYSSYFYSIKSHITAISQYCPVTKDYAKDQIHVQALAILSVIETCPEMQQPDKPPAAGQVQGSLFPSVRNSQPTSLQIQRPTCLPLVPEHVSLFSFVYKWQGFRIPLCPYSRSSKQIRHTILFNLKCIDEEQNILVLKVTNMERLISK